MELSSPWLPEELNFLAEEEVHVRIVPHFQSEKMTFLSGVYGPFQANLMKKVPLWLALFLNSSESCTLQPPKWLNWGYIRTLVEKEKADHLGLQKVPSHYMEVSFAFFTRSPRSIQNLDRVRAGIEDLWMIRIEKIRRSLLEMEPGVDSGKLENGTRMEVHMFREPLTRIRTLLTSMKEMNQ
jgi:GINS complex subunit 2